jgi:hypothetical protein
MKFEIERRLDEIDDFLQYACPEDCAKLVGIIVDQKIKPRKKK